MQITIIQATVAILIAAAGAAHAQSTKITSPDAFNTAVVGKKLSGGNGNEVVITASGQISGTIGGKKITASGWKWNGTQFCRALKTSDREFPSACQDVSIDGNVVTMGQTSWTIN